MSITYNIPPKLKYGQHIRVVAPSRSCTFVHPQSMEFAMDRLRSMGFQVSFSDHAFETDAFNSSSIASRIDDIHTAFKDPSVHAILTAIGGYNANQLLEHMDYGLIAANPKILCGFSDISVLCNAITAVTGLVTYMGPHVSSFGMQKGFAFTQQSFEACLMKNDSYEAHPSHDWSDDPWFSDQENRTFLSNEGPWILNSVPGVFEGRLIGGHQGGFGALQGTRFWPDLKDTLLLMEDTAATNLETFERRLTAITQQSGFGGVKAVLIGRFQKQSLVDKHRLKAILSSNQRLASIPVVANLDFGHTTPILTLPIGGRARLELTQEDGCKLVLLQH